MSDEIQAERPDPSCTHFDDASSLSVEKRARRIPLWGWLLIGNFAPAVVLAGLLALQWYLLR
jgi:hypothetical protein